MKDGVKKSSGGAGCVVKSCGCKANGEGNAAGAEFQDERYGTGNRVHNRTAKGLCCTVCGKKS